MNLMKHLFFFSFLFIFLPIVNAIAQTPTNLGYYQLNEGELVPGKIIFDSKTHAEKFTWVSADGKTEKTFSIYAAARVSDGQMSYRALVIPRHIEFLDISYEIMNDDSIVSERIVLTQIFSGKYINLWYHKKEKENFFVEMDGKLEELVINYRYLTERELLSFYDAKRVAKFYVFNTYRDQLKNMLGDILTSKLRDKLLEVELTKFSLIRFLKAANKEKD